MPAYDFKCKICNHQFTVRISIAERDKVKCPQCNSSSVQQIFSPCAVSVKGSSTGSSCGSSCGMAGFG